MTGSPVPPVNRRRFLTGASVAALSASGLSASGLTRADDTDRLPVAGIATVYTHNSHADVILGKILQGYAQDGGVGPNLRLHTLYLDQVPSNDLGRKLAQEHGVKLVETIDEAITLGGDRVEVAGVLSIGEHGNYPSTETTHQRMYPRRRFFDQILAAFDRCGKVVPIFNDKHLSYREQDALEMWQAARDRRIPFMAGSSLPVTWRRPAVSLPMDCAIEQAVAVGYGGLESYGFHALETLQCMVERRKGGETGVRSVQALQGEAMWEAERQGRWSRSLVNAALATLPGQPELDPEKLNGDAAIYLIEYRDGANAAVAMANGIAGHFAFAARLRGSKEPVATWFELDDGRPYEHFAHLLRAIESMILTGKPAYPVERTLVTTGILDAAMRSLAERHRTIPTPRLDVHYTPADWTFANRDAG